MTAVIRRIVAHAGVALVLLVWPEVARAHAIHTTLTVLSDTPGGITFTVRSFADDFSASVARHAGRAIPRDSSVRADDVTRYVRAHFDLHDAHGRAVVLVPCGIRRQGELYFACFRAAVADGTSGLRLRNRMLTELHADQVNIVQVEGIGARRTMLFTRASAPSVISARS